MLSVTSVLRHFVPAVRKGLRKVILGLRILQGRCINGNEAAEMNVQPGNRPILDDDIVKAGKLIIEGLSFLEGRCSRESDVCVCVTPTKKPFPSQQDAQWLI